MMFKVEKKENFTILNFELNAPVVPDELKRIKIPEINYSKGVVISGRGPVWLYGYLVHELHPAAWVATHDPRLNGGVVVATHVPGINVGDVIPLE